MMFLINLLLLIIAISTQQIPLKDIEWNVEIYSCMILWSDHTME